jgi:hypothetical protein
MSHLFMILSSQPSQENADRFHACSQRSNNETLPAFIPVLGYSAAHCTCHSPTHFLHKAFNRHIKIALATHPRALTW